MNCVDIIILKRRDHCNNCFLVDAILIRTYNVDYKILNISM